MAQYRIPEFELEQRFSVGVQMLAPDRPWGLVTQLSQQYNVSRTRLCEIRATLWAASVVALRPGEAGRPAQPTVLQVDKSLIDRTIAVLPLLKGSVRDIRLGLELILGVSHSVGYISETLRAAGAQATAANRELRAPLPILGEADEIFQAFLYRKPASNGSAKLPILGKADEIFQGRQPCRTLVDGRSFLVLHLTPAAARDSTTWGVTYLDLVARGIQFHDLACDGGPARRSTGSRVGDALAPGFVSSAPGRAPAHAAAGNGGLPGAGDHRTRATRRSAGAGAATPPGTPAQGRPVVTPGPTGASRGHRHL